MATKVNDTINAICYECKYRQDLVGDCHSQCLNRQAKVTGHQHGIKNGWFVWPFNFDPIWLLECDGFEKHEKKD